MSISSYPRRGCSLVPQILRPLLDVPLLSFWRVDALRDIHKLCDLDAQVWQKVGASDCKMLGRDVVKQVARSLPRFWNVLSPQKLPLPPGGARLDDLELGEATCRRLRSKWPESQSDAEFLAGKTIGQALELRGFGADNLVDLLCSIEAFQKSKVADGKLTDGQLAAQARLLEEDLEDSPGELDLEAAAPVSSPSVLQEAVFEVFNRKSDAVSSSHNADYGALLEEVDESVDTLREGMHRVVHLLHSGYDLEEGQSALELVWQSLESLKQSASALEALALATPSQWAWAPPLDENLTQLVQSVDALVGGDEIDHDDPRLPVLREVLIPGQQLHDFIQSLLGRTRDPQDAIRLKAELKGLCENIQEMRGQTVEQELLSILKSLSGRWTAPERKLEILSRRYGLEDGRATGSLDKTAFEFQVTPQRIRQIITPSERAVGALAHFAPALDRALDWLEKQAPLPIEEVGPRLQGEGLTSHAMSFKTLRRIAGLLGREMPVETGLVGQKSFVQGTDKQAIALLRLARRQVSHWGLGTVEDITATFNAQGDGLETEGNEEVGDEDLRVGRDVAPAQGAVEADMVRRVLAAQSDFAFLDEDRNWFWFSKSARNGLITQIEKVLAVAPRINVSPLRAGVGRDHLRHGFAPPGRVLLEFCRQLPGLSVEGNEVVVTSRALGVLGPTEALMAKTLSENGGVMQRAQFERMCAEKGMPRGTFFRYLMHSPIVDKYAPGIYGLRGASIEPGVIESLSTSGRRARTRVVKESGWTKDGKMWLSYALSQGIIDNKVCSVPIEIRHHLQGKFSLQAADGAPVGTWVGKDYSAWGFGGFLRRRGGEAGDILLLVFDLQGRTATIALGDETLIEELQDDESE